VLKRVRRLVYLEDQYLWGPFVADLLADALRANRDLQVIAIVPRYPDKEGAARWPSLVGRQEAIRVCRSAGGDRWIITSWERCGRVWANPPVPCMHADPVLPDCPSGETVRVKGRLWFYEGPDIDRELQRANS